MSDRVGVAAQVRRAVEFVHEQVQHRLPAPTQRAPQVCGEVEGECTFAGPAEQLLKLRLQACPGNHEAQLLTVGRPGDLGGLPW